MKAKWVNIVGEMRGNVGSGHYVRNKQEKSDSFHFGNSWVERI